MWLMGLSGIGPVLVVLDDPPIRELLLEASEGEQLEVTSAADGEDAIRLALEQQPSLVVLDIGLPRVDGAGAATAIRERYGDAVPVIVVTANNRLEEASWRVRAAAYFSKPFDVPEPVRAVRAAIQPPPEMGPEGSPAVAG